MCQISTVSDGDADGSVACFKGSNELEEGRIEMRLGVISDTHGMLRPAVRTVFSEVDRIVHCGDVGSPEIIDHLGLLAPLSVAYGNTDGFAVRNRSSRVVRIECDDRVVVALHGDEFGIPNPASLMAEFPDADVILFGHTHKPLVEKSSGGVVVMNPGAAGAVRCSCQPSVGMIEFGAGSAPLARIVPLDSSCKY